MVSSFKYWSRSATGRRAWRWLSSDCRAGEPGLREADLWFGRLGEETGKMHAHAQSWNLPAGFCRKRWDFDAMVGPAWPMGPWRAARRSG